MAFVAQGRGGKTHFHVLKSILQHSPDWRLGFCHVATTQLGVQEIHVEIDNQHNEQRHEQLRHRYLLGPEQQCLEKVG